MLQAWLNIRSLGDLTLKKTSAKVLKLTEIGKKKIYESPDEETAFEMYIWAILQIPKLMLAMLLLLFAICFESPISLHL